MRFGSWKMNTCPYLIEYSVEVLERIVADIRSGHQSQPLGHVPIGGLLFGAGDVTRVRIMAGVSFPLTQHGSARLSRLAREYGSYPELSRMSLVGWFHSDSREGRQLRPVDAEIHERSFREPWQILIVLGPPKADSLGASVFGRSETGKLSPDPVFETNDVTEGIDLLPPAEAAPEESSPNPEGDTPPPSGRQLFAAFGEQVRNSRLPRSRQGLRIALLLAAVIGIGTLSYWIGPRDWRQRADSLGKRAGELLSAVPESESQGPAELAQKRLSLIGLTSESGVDILWDPTASILTEAAKGEIEIGEGQDVVRVPLERMEMERGQYHLGPQAHDAKIRFVVHRMSGEPYAEQCIPIPLNRLDEVDERTHLAGQQTRPEPEGQSSGRRREEQTKEAGKLTETTLSARNQSRQQAKADAPSPPPSATPSAQRTRKPVLLEKGMATPANRLNLAPLRTAAISSDTAASASPRSGRLIWTGYLPVGEPLVIDEGKPSVGQLSGRLPGEPISVALSMGELSRSGLIVYRDPRIPQDAAVEKASNPSATLPLTYKSAPDRAYSVSVVESPSAENRWGRLSFKSEHRPLSVVVIDWKRLE